jgi:hypothetical protein
MANFVTEGAGNVNGPISPPHYVSDLTAYLFKFIIVISLRVMAFALAQLLLI